MLTCLPHVAPDGAPGKAPVTLLQRALARARATLLGGVLAAGAILVPAGAARAVVLQVTPGLSAGVTSNANNDPNTARFVTPYEAFSTVRGSAAMVLTEAGATHLVGYGFQLTGYAQTTAANNVSQDIRWRSTLNLSARTELSMGVETSIFRFSALPTTDPMAGDTTSTPTGTASTVINGSAFETLGYQPSGRIRYSQAVNANYLKPFGQGGDVPTVLTLNAFGRGERGAGKDVFTLTTILTDLVLLQTTPNTPPSDYQLTSQLLGGYRRELNANASIEVQGGAQAFINTTAGSVALGPSGIATGSYRRLPWFATLVLAHAPTVNMYAGESVIADSATLRVSMPLNKRETLVVAGFGGYTFARRVTGQSHFVFAPRVYDLFILGGTLGYRFERLPFAVTLDYNVTDQRGSIIGERTYPSTRRTFYGLTVTGALAWGEGQHGLVRPQ